MPVAATAATAAALGPTNGRRIAHHPPNTGRWVIPVVTVRQMETGDLVGLEDLLSVQPLSVDIDGPAPLGRRGERGRASIMTFPKPYRLLLPRTTSVEAIWKHGDVVLAIRKMETLHSGAAVRNRAGAHWSSSTCSTSPFMSRSKAANARRSAMASAV